LQGKPKALEEHDLLREILVAGQDAEVEAIQKYLSIRSNFFPEGSLILSGQAGINRYATFENGHLRK